MEDNIPDIEDGQELYQTPETSKYYTPHFKAGSLTAIISPETQEFMANEKIGHAPICEEEYKINDSQKLRLQEMQWKMVEECQTTENLEHLYMQSKNNHKYKLFWRQ